MITNPVDKSEISRFAEMKRIFEKSLVAALQPGLELVPHPYAALAQRVGMTEHDCNEMLGRWIDEATIRRFGSESEPVNS